MSKINQAPQLYLNDRYLRMVKDILQTHLPHSGIWAYGSRVNGDHYEASNLNLVVLNSHD